MAIISLRGSSNCMIAPQFCNLDFITMQFSYGKAVS